MCLLRLLCAARREMPLCRKKLYRLAFEIKTACDEISRRLLRWHWEHKPGRHSLDALLEHIASASRKARIITTVCRI